MLGERPCSPRPPPLVRFADKALCAFPKGVRFAAAAFLFHIEPLSERRGERLGHVRLIVFVQPRVEGKRERARAHLLCDRT